MSIEPNNAYELSDLDRLHEANDAYVQIDELLARSERPDQKTIQHFLDYSDAYDRLRPTIQRRLGRTVAGHDREEVWFAVTTALHQSRRGTTKDAISSQVVEKLTQIPAPRGALPARSASRYAQDIHEAVSLSDRELSDRIRHHDPVAAAAVVVRFQDFVYKRAVAATLLNRDSDSNYDIESEFEDVFQEGMLGFLQGVALWRPNDKLTLRMYASRSMNWAMYRYLAEEADVVRLPGKLINYAQELEQENFARAEHHAFPLNDHEIAEHFSLKFTLSAKEWTVADLLQVRALLYMTPLEAVVDQTRHDQLETHNDDIVDTRLQITPLHGEPPLDPTDLPLLTRSLQREGIRIAVEQALSEREKIILEKQFGMTGDPQTNSVIGRSLGVTATRVQQLGSKLPEKLSQTAPSHLRDLLD